MSVSAAFSPMGNTVVIAAANVAPSAVQANSLTIGGNNYRLINAGNVTVFLGVGGSAATANSNAVVLTSGNAAFTVPLLSGTDEILSFVPNAWFTGITASGSANVFVTPGDGI